MFLSPGSRANAKMTALWRAISRTAAFGHIGNVEKITDISFNGAGVIIGNPLPLGSGPQEHLNLVDTIGANINYLNATTTRRAATIRFLSDGVDGGAIQFYTKVSGGILSNWFSLDNAGNLSISGPSNTFSGSVTASSNLTTSGTLIASSNASVVGSLTLSGSANQFVQGNGTFALQGRKLLNTLTAANSSVLSDITSLTSAFTDYEIMFTNILPGVNNATLNLQVRSGGTFQSSSYNSNTYSFSNGSPTIATAVSSTFIFCSPGTALGIPNTAPGMSGFMRVSNVASSSTPKIFGGTTWYANNAALAGNAHLSGYWNNTAVIDGFQLTMSSSNITSGNVKIYGIG